VLEPIFEADLPPEQYAYRPGRNAQQAVVKVEELLCSVAKSDSRLLPSLSRATPSAVSEQFSELIGCRGVLLRRLIFQAALRARKHDHGLCYGCVYRKPQIRL